MPVVDVEYAVPPAFADRVASVRAQLEPINSRRALIESYRRESLCCLAGSVATDTATEALEMAYALRWFELEPELEEGPPVEEGFEPVYGQP